MRRRRRRQREPVEARADQQQGIRPRAREQRRRHDPAIFAHGAEVAQQGVGVRVVEDGAACFGELGRRLRAGRVGAEPRDHWAGLRARRAAASRTASSSAAARPRISTVGESIIVA